MKKTIPLPTYYYLSLTNYLAKGGRERWRQQNFHEHVCKEKSCVLAEMLLL